MMNSAKVIDHKDLIGIGKLQMKFWLIHGVERGATSDAFLGGGKNER